MPTPLIDLVEEFPAGVDQFHITNKDPDYYYCFINKKAENVQRAKDIWGYEIIGASHKESAMVPPNAVGERVIGDVVLARMPRERHERIERMRQKTADAQLSAANDAWKENADKAGLKVEDTTVVEQVLGKKGG